ncbi:MAG TPA: chromate transporter [Bacteroidetes bacterium]|nr:chromate transporter [Candidatus Limimorpha avicola]
MIYLQLCWVFIKIGILGFGGGYAMLSMIQFEIVEHHAWMTASDFADIVAISQMTPGPVSINLATYTGYTIGGIAGSLLSTFSLVLPSLLLLFIVLKFLLKNKENFIIKTTLSTMKPIIAGLILSAAILMMNKENFGDVGFGKNNISIIICAITFAGVYFLKINPMWLILASGVAGWLIY